MCNKCNDTGILGIRNGDDDIPCDCNEINTSAPETVASVESLSPIAQLRLQLDTMDKAWAEVHDIRTVKLYNGIKEDFDLDLSIKLHAVFAEIDRLQTQNDLFVKGIHILNGFPSCASGKVLDYDRKVAEQVVLHLGVKMDEESKEYLASVEDEIQETEDKYLPEVHDETR